MEKIKCQWVYKTGKICKNTNWKEGFCKKHYLGEISWNDEGIFDNNESEPDTIESCSHCYLKSFRVGNSRMIEMCPFEINFIEDRTQLKYSYFRTLNCGTVQMKLLNPWDDDSEIIQDELINFYPHPNDRKEKALKSLKSEEFLYNCQKLACLKIEDNFFCESCFTLAHGGMISNYIKNMTPLGIIRTD
jgi:hypothetical protein